MGSDPIIVEAGTGEGQCFVCQSATYVQGRRVLELIYIGFITQAESEQFAAVLRESNFSFELVCDGSVPMQIAMPFVIKICACHEHHVLLHRLHASLVTDVLIAFAFVQPAAQSPS